MRERSKGFIRSKTVKGRTYYQLVRNYRSWKDGRVRQRMIVSLGTHPTVEEAYRAAEEKYFKAPRRTEAAWKQLVKLDRALHGFERKPRSEGGDPRKGETKAFRAERLRRARQERRLWERPVLVERIGGCTNLSKRREIGECSVCHASAWVPSGYGDAGRNRRRGVVLVCTECF